MDDHTIRYNFDIEPTKYCQSDFEQLIQTETNARFVNLILPELEATRDNLQFTPKVVYEQGIIRLMELHSFSLKTIF